MNVAEFSNAMLICIFLYLPPVVSVNMIKYFRYCLGNYFLETVATVAAITIFLCDLSNSCNL